MSEDDIEVYALDSREEVLEKLEQMMDKSIGPLSVQMLLPEDLVPESGMVGMEAAAVQLIYGLPVVQVRDTESVRHVMEQCHVAEANGVRYRGGWDILKSDDDVWIALVLDYKFEDGSSEQLIVLFAPSDNEEHRALMEYLAFERQSDLLIVIEDTELEKGIVVTGLSNKEPKAIADFLYKERKESD